MVGSMALTTVADEQRSWEIQYSRLFTYLPPPTSHPSSLTPIAKGRYKSAWLSSATPTAILSLSADPPRSDFILTISFHGIILEQHYASKLRFSWPQLSCMSNVPQQCSRVVLVSYKDGASVTQKFGLRFSTYYEVGDFVAMLEVGLSNKQLFEDFISIRSSQSEAKDMLSEVVLTGASQIPNMTPLPYQPKSGQDITASHSSEGYISNISESYVPEISECYIPEISDVYAPPVVPPRFTSFVTNCSEMAHGQGVAATIPTASHEVDLKSLIAQYLEDASFLGIKSARAKPLHWTLCLKIAEDVAQGLSYIHQAKSFVHGNLKSSNVLLGSDFEARLTEYCLTALANNSSIFEEEEKGPGSPRLDPQTVDKVGCLHVRSAIVGASDR